MDEPRRLCPHEGCDQVNSAAARFCARCGRPLPAPDPRSLGGATAWSPGPSPQASDAADAVEFAWRLGGFVIIVAALLIGSAVLFRLQGLTNGIWLVLPLVGFGAWINPWRRRT